MGKTHRPLEIGRNVHEGVWASFLDPSVHEGVGGRVECVAEMRPVTGRS